MHASLPPPTPPPPPAPAPDPATACLQVALARTSAANVRRAYASLLDAFAPVSLRLVGGAVASLTPAQAVASCDGSLVVACSFPSPFNEGIPTPLWCGARMRGACGEGGHGSGCWGGAEHAYSVLHRSAP